MIAGPSVTTRSIQLHYDTATLFYWLLWGPHIHHGLWEEELSPSQAQLRLIHRLAMTAAIEAGDRVLDVGCGMGGSTIELAARYGCSGTGVTLSRVQRSWASLKARWQGVSSKVRFLCQDAERMQFPLASFDVVWNVECSEHFFDKPAFFRRAASWLKPGGRLALCAWLAVERPEAEPQVKEVCKHFLCPSLGTAEDYCGWLEAAGLTVHTCADLTPQVTRTWEICERRVQGPGTGFLRLIAGRKLRSFVAHLAALSGAYRSGAMQYGLFVAEKPS